MVKHDKTQQHPYKYYNYYVYNGILMTRQKKGIFIISNSFTLQWCQSRTLSLLTFWSARRHYADEKFQKTMATRLFRVILVRRGHDPFGQSQYIFGAEQNNRHLWD